MAEGTSTGSRQVCDEGRSASSRPWLLSSRPGARASSIELPNASPGGLPLGRCAVLQTVNFFWGPFFVSTSYGLWTCEYQAVADQEVLSIVEMTLTFKGDRQPGWGSAARLRLVTSIKAFPQSWKTHL